MSLDRGVSRENLVTILQLDHDVIRKIPSRLCHLIMVFISEDSSMIGPLGYGIIREKDS